MISMLSCFNLRPGIEIGAFKRLYRGFVEAMEHKGLIVSAGPVARRERDTPMDTDDERDHEFFSVMTFSERAQLDAAYAYISEQVEPGRSEHQQVFKWVADPVFICWRDTESFTP